MGKQSRKLFNKQATSKKNVEQIKRTDGRDRQIADVRGGNLDDGSLQRRVFAAGSVGFDEIGIGEVGGNRIYSSGVAREHIANGAVSPAKLDRSYALVSHSHPFPDSTGSALSGTAYSHSHSISSTTFIKQSKSERMRMLGDRLDLEELLHAGHLHPEDAVLARNTLNVLTLLMDYTDMNAYQRERAFADPACAEWSDAYKRVYGVDEYAESDRTNFLAYGQMRMDPYTGIAPRDRGH